MTNFELFCGFFHAIRSIDIISNDRKNEISTRKKDTKQRSRIGIGERNIPQSENLSEDINNINCFHSARDEAIK